MPTLNRHKAIKSPMDNLNLIKNFKKLRVYT